MSSPAVSTPADSADPMRGTRRRDAVDKARQAWISRLIDLSQRNNLLYFRPLKVGTLDLTAADRDALAELLSGKSVPLHKLLPPDADRVKINAQAKEIARKAKENVEERGLETLSLAAGMASWEGENGKRPPESAVLLVPVALDVKGRGAVPTLKRTGEPQVNPVLLHVLASQFRCTIEPDELLKAADTDPDRDDDPFDLDALLAKLTELCGTGGAAIGKFEVRRRVVLGNFSFQKMAMVRDLRELGGQLTDNDVIAGLAGDPDARTRVTSSPSAAGSADTDPDPRDFDKAPPQNEFLVLDTDSTEQKAITLAQRGKSLVIQGPPGTGKSQVIANLIVASAAAGKRVLFVAEKRAALQVVLDRLNRCDLGYLALDLHGADTSRKVIAGRLRDALANVDRGAPVTSDQILQPFSQRREKLNAHDARMHKKRPPAELSVFELQEHLLRPPNVPGVAVGPQAHPPALKTRFRAAALMQLTPQAVAQAKDALTEAAAMADLFLGTRQTPWINGQFLDGHAAQAAIDEARELADETFPSVRDQAWRLLSAVRPAPPASLGELEMVLLVAANTNAFLQSFDEKLFAEDLPALVEALYPASRGALSRLWATLTSARYRRAKATMNALAKKPLAVQAMPDAAREARNIAGMWRHAGFAPATPRAVAGASEAHAAVDSARRRIAQLGESLRRDDLTSLPPAELEMMLNALRDDADTARRIPPLRNIEKTLAQLGLTALMAELRKTQPPPQTWADAFERAWLTSCLEHAWAEEPELASFNGQVHNRSAAEFREYDRQRLQLAGKTVAKKHVEEATKMLAGLKEQSARVRREAEKKIRHLPFRKLMDEAPDVLAALFPCFMCSPLSVSQLLPGDRKLFDLVIFDEASQVLPEDAVASLVRGNQAVVAGDEHQLPPTQFFAGGADEDDSPDDQAESSDAEGFESLLKMMKAFVPAPMLQWHYRSRDERLIAFSNRHIYDSRLITFPGPGRDGQAVRHILVDDRENASGDESSDSSEVQRIVALVLEHAAREIARPPDRRLSLGVIALGIPHARRVEAAIDRALEDRPELEAFFDPNLPERFFVKNLERVQGDERDAIVLTLGVSPDKAGRASLTAFGPLNNREQGYRRLNVAVTRARQTMTVVSSFAHHGIDLSGGKSVSRGVELLRGYLQFAAAGGDLGDDRGRSDIAPNTFEADVADALASVAKIKTVPQWGASSYRIDLVAQHPTRPGRFVLAIECDGATYHSAPTARDRDRLRQQHLEALGWKFHRIWSADWFARRDEEIRRAQAAFAAAVAFADQIDGVVAV
jgi:very-short-patch-repair endonuclease